MRTRLPTCLSVGFGAFFASVAMAPPPFSSMSTDSKSVTIETVCDCSRSTKRGLFANSKFLRNENVRGFARFSCKPVLYTMRGQEIRPACGLKSLARRRVAVHEPQERRRSKSIQQRVHRQGGRKSERRSGAAMAHQARLRWQAAGTR